MRFISLRIPTFISKFPDYFSYFGSKYPLFEFGLKVSALEILMRNIHFSNFGSNYPLFSELIPSCLHCKISSVALYCPFPLSHLAVHDQVNGSGSLPFILF